MKKRISVEYFPFKEGGSTNVFHLDEKFHFIVKDGVAIPIDLGSIDFKSKGPFMRFYSLEDLQPIFHEDLLEGLIETHHLCPKSSEQFAATLEYFLTCLLFEKRASVVVKSKGADLVILIQENGYTLHTCLPSTRVYEYNFTLLSKTLDALNWFKTRYLKLKEKPPYALYSTSGVGNGVYFFNLEYVKGTKRFSCSLEVWMDHPVQIMEDRTQVFEGRKEDFPFWEEVQRDLDALYWPWSRCEWG